MFPQHKHNHLITNRCAGIVLCQQVNLTVISAIHPSMQTGRMGEGIYYYFYYFSTSQVVKRNYDQFCFKLTNLNHLGLPALRFILFIIVTELLWAFSIINNHIELYPLHTENYQHSKKILPNTRYNIRLTVSPWQPFIGIHASVNE